MFNEYPYLNLSDLNLDFILNAIREMKYEVTNFVSLNAIKYADPIQWNITSQYEKNTVVIDPLTGVAYISVTPVPSGVALTRTEYWSVVFDLGSFVTRAAQNFTSRWESETTTIATFSTNTGEWLVWGDVLYKALTNITQGNNYVVGVNIEHFTIEDLYNAYLNTVASILAMVGDLQDLTTSDTSDIVHAINSVLNDLNITIGDLASLTTSDTSDIVNAINSVLNDLNITIGDLDDLNTSDKSSVVNAINDVISDYKSADAALALLTNKGLNAYGFTDNFKYQTNYSNLTGVTTYNGMQGACYNPVRDSFVIGFIQSGNESNGMLVEVKPDFSTVVQRVAYPNNELRHCNDMTYNTKTDKIYIAGYETNSTNMSVIEVDPVTLAVIREIPVLPVAIDSAHALGKIAYDVVNDRYVAASNHDFMLYDASFNYIESIPFTMTDFDIHYGASVSFRPLQSLEVFNGKWFALYTVQNGNTGSGAVVIYDANAKIEQSYPISIYPINCECESISKCNDGLKILSGNGLGLLPMDFKLSNVPYSSIGNDLWQLGVDLNNVDLNDIYTPGVYNRYAANSVSNSPFTDYVLYVLPASAGFIQIAVKSSSETYIATRNCNYLGAWNPWTYLPYDFKQKGQTYTISVSCGGLISTGGTELSFYIPIGHIANGVNNSDLTVSAFNFYTATTTGIINPTESDCHVNGVAVWGDRHELQFRIGKNDGTAFGTGGTPVFGTGTFTLTIA